MDDYVRRETQIWMAFAIVESSQRCRRQTLSHVVEKDGPISKIRTREVAIVCPPLNGRCLNFSFYTRENVEKDVDFLC